MAQIETIASPVATSTSSSIVLASNGDRRGVFFQNFDATDTIFLSNNGEAAVAASNAVLKLAPGTGTFFDGEWAASEWRAIASANTPALGITARLA